MDFKRIPIMLTTLLFSASLLAGFSQPAPVEINLGEGFGSAQGDMITARNSDSDFEFIGCGQRVIEDGLGGVFQFGFCQAQIEEDSSVVCFTENKDLLDGIDSIADSSFITFSWTDDGEGNLTCNRIGTSTQSFYLEKGQKIK